MRTERVRWAEPGSRFTRDFEELAAWLAREMSISAVTRYYKVQLELGGATDQSTVVNRHLDTSRLDDLYAIGIDEVSWREVGHDYRDTGGEPRHRRTGVDGRRSLPGRIFSRFFDQLSPAQANNIQVV